MLKKYKTIIPTILLAIVILATGFSVTDGYYLQILTFIGINAILVLGLNMLMGYAGQISLGHAAFYGIGAYTTAILTGTYGFSPLIAMPLSILAAVLVALFIGHPTLKLSGYYLGMGTLGFGMIVHVLLREFSSITGGSSGFVGIPILEIPLPGRPPIAIMSGSEYFFLVWAAVLITVIACQRIVASRTGRALISVHDSENAAKAMGINTHTLKLKIFVFSAATGGLAGFLYTHFVCFISPDSFSFMESVKLVTMVVIGGMASIWGAFLGAIVITLLPELLHSFAEFEMVVYGMILMGVMIFMPQGLTKGLMDLYEKSRGNNHG